MRPKESESIKFVVKITCPYCQIAHEQAIFMKHPYYFSEYFPVFCDIEQGGCDRLFLIKAHLVPATTVLKVEGTE